MIQVELIAQLGDRSGRGRAAEDVRRNVAGQDLRAHEDQHRDDEERHGPGTDPAGDKPRNGMSTSAPPGRDGGSATRPGGIAGALAQLDTDTGRHF
jgi:hypothetical protein